MWTLSFLQLYFLVIYKYVECQEQWNLLNKIQSANSWSYQPMYYLKTKDFQHPQLTESLTSYTCHMHFIKYLVAYVLWFAAALKNKLFYQFSDPERLYMYSIYMRIFMMVINYRERHLRSMQMKTWITYSIINIPVWSGRSGDRGTMACREVGSDKG